MPINMVAYLMALFVFQSVTIIYSQGDCPEVNPKVWTD